MFDYSSNLMRVTERILQKFVSERICACKVDTIWRKELADFIEIQYPKHVSQYEKIHLFLQKKSFNELEIELFDITLLSTLLEFSDFFKRLYSLDSKQHRDRVCNHIRILREARNALEHAAKTPEVVNSRDHYFEQLNAIYCICAFCSVVLDYFSDDDYWKKTLKEMKRLENMLFGEKWIFPSNSDEVKETNSLSDMIEMAEKGNARSQYLLGRMYYDGEQIDSDYDRAFMWFRKAAKKGDVDALYYVGKCYDHGFGVDYNSTQAREYYRSSAENGCPGACYEMANNLLFEQTNEALKDSYKWAKKAAELGDPRGFWILSFHYSMGKVVKKNIEKKKELQIKAAEGGYKFACNQLAAEARNKKDYKDEIYWLEREIKLTTDDSDKRRLLHRINRIKSKIE